MVVSDNVSTNIYSFLKMKLVGTALRCSPCKRTPMALLFLSRLRQLAKSYIIQREAYYCAAMVGLRLTSHRAICYWNSNLLEFR
jgi:hypothetical protein